MKRKRRTKEEGDLRTRESGHRVERLEEKKTPTKYDRDCSVSFVGGKEIKEILVGVFILKETNFLKRLIKSIILL